MAKKTATKKSAAPTKKAPAAKPAKKKAPAKKSAEVELVLEPAEEKALDLVEKSKRVCKDLEEEVTKAISGAVATVFNGHGVSLTPRQAKNIALLLFGD